MARDKWYDSDDPGVVMRGAGWRAGAWVLVVAIVLAVVGGIVWAIGVATSDANGRGNAIKRKNSAANRISAQENFEQLYQDILSSDRRLDQAAQDKRDHPGDPTYAANYTGLRNHCQELVGTYNADSRKYTQEQFRAADLPYQIDDTNPATDCKEKIAS